MASREGWTRLLDWLLYQYRREHWPFCNQAVHSNVNPQRNHCLNAKIDLERALEAGCKDAEAIVGFLRVEEEGWFFGGTAEKISLLLEIAQSTVQY